jgi:hypothetical protein
MVVNDCGHAATQVTVVIDRGGNVVADAAPMDVKPFDELLFDLTDAIKQHLELVRMNPVRQPRLSGPVVSAGSNGEPVSTTFRAHIRWLTEQQVPRTDVVHEVVRHQMTFDGIRRLKRGDRG